MRSKKIRIPKGILVAQLVILVASCGTKKLKDTDEMPIPKATLLRISEEYLKAHHPEWTNRLSLPPVVVDRGGYWQVSFELPNGMLGGTPVVEIRKGSHEVIKAYHTQ
jgi:hypothetical protein